MVTSAMDKNDIVTIPKHLLAQRITRLSLEKKMSTIRDAVLVALGL
jgi:hypothetical protein